jgi:hypothetical protein
MIGLFKVDSSLVNITGIPRTRKYKFLKVKDINSLRKKRIAKSFNVLFFLKAFFLLKNFKKRPKLRDK